ncbi:MAG: NAD-dependent epimerase/dehydratase family protein [Deltaproteobacteria bacterium]|nr:NAD-dependent epimerase/dehydratase family protein [Deltaproteobacteria bacterium]MBI3294188.1 NAD-dependent epimerase/dehydratase family protein [Deltaproteobacteria bacterium]
MAVALVTGSSGLVGSETVKFLVSQGLEVHGLDNDMRSYFFGGEASTQWNAEWLTHHLKPFHHHSLDIRNEAEVNALFGRFGGAIDLIVHAAAQPSHDWAAREPLTDFSVNAVGTLVLLEAARRHCPAATFIFISTNKVYGDRPNSLPILEGESRYEVDPKHPFAQSGIDETMPIDQSKHSLFGVSKMAADLLVQEYGRYFGMKTGVFRGGCLAGPAHSGVELHGFLPYLVRCAVTGIPYRIFGYRGKQVRDNIHSADLVSAFWHFYRQPGCAAVYNIGGSRHSHCSILEVIQLIQEIAGREISYTIEDGARTGDHIWWISDVRKFQHHYPGWSYRYDLRGILTEMVEAARERYLTPQHFRQSLETPPLNA